MTLSEYQKQKIEKEVAESRKANRKFITSQKAKITKASNKFARGYGYGAGYNQMIEEDPIFD
jgi:hypothetical protein